MLASRPDVVMLTDPSMFKATNINDILTELHELKGVFQKQVLVP